jgi:hypothetical protein
VAQVNFRRTNVATKLKVTYVKDSFLDVKIQYKACQLTPPTPPVITGNETDDTTFISS